MISTEDLQTILGLYQNGNAVEAEIQVRQGLQSSPGHRDLLRLGALTALSLNQVMTAHSRLTKAAKDAPMTAEISNTFGNILKAAGEWVSSEKAYRKAIDLDPNYEPVSANLVDLLVQSGQAEKALAELDRRAKSVTENELAIMARSTALMNLGRYDEALTIINSVKPPQDTDKLAIIETRLLYHMGRFAEMRTVADTVPLNSPAAAEILGITANADAMNGDWERAQNDIDAACADPDAHMGLLLKAISLLGRQGETEKTEAVRETALARFGLQAPILSDQSVKALKAGNTAEALSLSRQALSQKPGDFGLISQAIQAALAAGSYTDAEHLIQSAFGQSPNNQFLFALAATCMRLSGKPYEPLYDYGRFVRVYDLIPPPEYEDIAAFNVVLKHALESVHDFEGAPLNQSLRGGIQTDLDLCAVDNPVIQAFFKMLDYPIREYMKCVGTDPQHPLTRRNTMDYRINGAWSVKLFPQGHHVNHVHPMGWLSSSYYVDVPSVVGAPGSHEGWIKFGQPGLEGLSLEPEKFIQPKVGRLVLFPSYMWHGTVPFSGEETRLTLPFDVVPA